MKHIIGKIIDFEVKGNNVVRFYLGNKTDEWGWTKKSIRIVMVTLLIGLNLVIHIMVMMGMMFHMNIMLVQFMMNSYMVQEHIIMI